MTIIKINRENVMKRLIFVILLTILCAAILYTCASPLAVGNNFGPTNTFKSRPITSSNLFLAVQVLSSSINIGFYTNSGFISNSMETITSSSGITGYYPIINFQNGAVSGTITFIDESELKITFQNHNPPYFKMWDVICSK